MDVKTFVSKHKFPGKVIFAKIWGSRSHNCDKPDSDWDYSGVYALPTVSFLGFESHQDSCVSAKDTKPDWQFHEVKKFCNLLLEGNPTITEMLWTEHLVDYSNDWAELRHWRKKFLSKAVLKQYLEFAKDQLRRLVNNKSLHTTGGTFNEKWAYHLMRLLGDSERILKGEGPKVWKEGLERDFLMAIRGGHISAEDIKNIAEEKIAKQNDMYEKSNLPEVGDKKWLAEWLIEIRGKN